MAVMSYADYAICPGCDRKALYMGDGEAPEGIEVWHSSCRAEQQAAALTPVYSWLANDLGFPVEVCMTDRPEWIDLRRLAAAWHAREQGTAHQDCTLTADDYVFWLLEETGWTETEGAAS